MPFCPRTRHTWRLRSRTMELGERTCIMGIVNVTPDSFSDGGQHATTDRAVGHALRLLEDGAAIVDIGGESTRPGAAAGTPDAISAEAEQARVVPVIAGVLRARPDAVISVDTYRAGTARAAVLAGAEIVNDVSGGLWDPAMFATCANLGCGVIVMHTRGLPSEWAAQATLPPELVVPTVLAGLKVRLQAALNVGIARDRIALDPGFGFGKRGGENWVLLAGLRSFEALGLPLMVGLSRKGFLSVDPQEGAGNRDDLTHAANVCAILSGAHLLRIHDVAGAVRSAAIADAVLRGALHVAGYLY